MSCPTCDHLKEDGVFCGSPALHNQHYCYFHLNARARRVQAARARLRGFAGRLQMPIFDNMHAVQNGLQQVIDALAADSLEPKRAGLMLYALQQAAANLNHTPGWQGQVPLLEAEQPLRALECRRLQEQYDLPFDTDLEDQPDVAAAEVEALATVNLELRKPPVRAALARIPATSETARPNSGAGNNHHHGLPSAGNFHNDSPLAPSPAMPSPVLPSPPVPSSATLHPAADAA